MTRVAAEKPVNSPAILPPSDPTVAAATLTRIAQSLLSTRQAYLDPSAVLVGTPPGHRQLDEWQQQLSECAAAWDSALEVTRGLLKDVRAIVDRGEGYAGRW